MVLGCAEIIKIEEITQDSIYEGRNIRILGRIGDVDLARNRFKLENNGHFIWIDASYLKQFPHSRVTLYQIIGELIKDPNSLGTDEEPLLVKAKIIRNMQGFDLRLFDLVLTERRKILNGS